MLLADGFMSLVGQAFMGAEFSKAVGLFRATLSPQAILGHLQRGVLP